MDAPATPGRGRRLIKVAVYEPESSLRMRLVELVSDVPSVSVVLAAGLREELFTEGSRPKQSLIVVGTHSGNSDGVSAIRQLIQKYPQAIVLAICDPGDSVTVSAALATGARGFLSWGANSLDFTAAISAIEMTTLPTPTGSSSRQLTARELQVLKYMSLGLSNKQIAERLYLSQNTINVFTRKLFHKLQVRNRSMAVATGIRLQIIS